MCGIIGYMTLKDDDRTLSKEKFFREALFTDTLRGNDSTGIMSVKGDAFTWAWSKQAVPAYKFITEKSFFEREVKTWCAVGHNRAATVGDVNTDNAHPFQHGPIILVHNGTLRSTYVLPHDNKKIQVDSELIAYNLSQEAPEDANKVLDKLSGAFALVWFDNRDESVNFVRNSERPMHFGINRMNDLLLFASDGFLLNFCSQRLNDASARPRDIYQLGTHQWLKYKKGSLVPEVTKVNPFIPACTPTHQYQDTTWPPMTGKKIGTTGSYRSIGEEVPRPGGRAAAVGKAMIAGSIRKIPAVHEEMIYDWYHLQFDKECMFIPQAFQPWGTSGYGMVYGKLWHAEWECYFDAYIGDCTAHTMQMYKNSSWTVFPVGVDHTSPNNPRGGTTFITKCKFFKWNGALPTKPLNEKDKPCVLIDIHGNEIKLDDDKADYVDGPHGDITVEAWWKLCMGGCIMCGDPLFITDHEDITWVGEMENRPVCLKCMEWSTKAVEDNDQRTREETILDMLRSKESDFTN